MPGAISNYFFRFIDLLISNWTLLFPFILFFALLFLKMIIYRAVNPRSIEPLERIGIEFCSIGFAIFFKAPLDKGSKFCQYFLPKDTIVQAVLISVLILIPTYVLAVYLFRKYQVTTRYSRYGYWGSTVALGFFMVFLGM